jgi:subtilisin family serine protease
MAGRLLLSLTVALAALGVSALPASSKDDFYLGVPVINANEPNTIPHKYIVVYNETFNDDDVFAHENAVIKTIAKRNIGKRSPTTGSLLSTSVNTFRINGWRAMALEADDLMINEIFSAKEVSYIEQDAYISLNDKKIQAQPPSGLARISSAERGSRMYTFDDSGGEGITVYVVDTGVRVTHDEFEGRASFGANFINDNVCSASLVDLGPPLPRSGEAAAHTLRRTRMSKATALTSQAPSAARPLVLLRRSISSLSRSWMPMALARARASSAECSLVRHHPLTPDLATVLC